MMGSWANPSRINFWKYTGNMRGSGFWVWRSVVFPLLFFNEISDFLGVVGYLILGVLRSDSFGEADLLWIICVLICMMPRGWKLTAGKKLAEAAQLLAF